VNEILKRGNYCVQAREQLSTKGYSALLKKLPFGEADFSKYMRIGKDDRLSKIAELLPPSFSSIYLISRLSNEQLKAGIETGVISPKATRKDIERFCDEGASETEVKSGEKSRPAANAPDKQKSIGSELDKEEDDDDLDFSGGDNEEIERESDGGDDDYLELDDDEDDAAASDSSQSTTAYRELVKKWKGGGLPRRSWLATASAVRDKFVDDVLLAEPFKPDPDE
jgi:hypothetical protein